MCCLFVIFIGVSSLFTFEKETLQDNEAIAYLYRLPSFIGGASAWKIAIAEYNEETKDFTEAVEVGKLNKNEYMPIKLEANKMYYIRIGIDFINIITITKPGASIFIKLKGQDIEKKVMDNQALITIMKRNLVFSGLAGALAYKSNEKDYLSDDKLDDKWEKLNPESVDDVIKEISKMNVSDSGVVVAKEYF